MKSTPHPLKNWRSHSTVRNGVAPRVDFTPDGNWFSRELVPISMHEEIVKADPKVAQFLMGRHAYRFFDFTEKLEDDLVVPVVRDISHGRFGFDFSDQIIDDAGLIGVDEVHHANRSRSVRRQVANSLQGKIPTSVESDFLTEVNLAYSLKTDTSRLFALGAVITTETLITGALRKTATDPSVDSEVRTVFKEHADDEATHHAFFGVTLTPIVWNQLKKDEADFMGGVVIPESIRKYLTINLDDCLCDLLAAGYSASQAERIIAESYPPDYQTKVINAGARPTLFHMQRSGMFENQAVLAGLKKNNLSVMIK